MIPYNAKTIPLTISYVYKCDLKGKVCGFHTDLCVGVEETHDVGSEVTWCQDVMQPELHYHPAAVKFPTAEK